MSYPTYTHHQEHLEMSRMDPEKQYFKTIHLQKGLERQHSTYIEYRIGL